MSVWVDAADVVPLSDSESYMIPYAALFFPASAAQSHLCHVQHSPNGCVVSGGWVLFLCMFLQKCTEMLLVHLGPVMQIRPSDLQDNESSPLTTRSRNLSDSLNHLIRLLV